MRRKLLALVIVGLLAFAGFSFTSTGNDSEHEDKSCCCCCPLTCCKMMGIKGTEDIDVNVENVKDGVVVKVTSKNANVAKKIQEMYAKMKEMCTQKECCEKLLKKGEIKK